MSSSQEKKKGNEEASLPFPFENFLQLMNMFSPEHANIFVQTGEKEKKKEKSKKTPRPRRNSFTCSPPSFSEDEEANFMDTGSSSSDCISSKYFFSGRRSAQPKPKPSRRLLASEKMDLITSFSEVRRMFVDMLHRLRSSIPEGAEFRCELQNFVEKILAEYPSFSTSITLLRQLGLYDRLIDAGKDLFQKFVVDSYDPKDMFTVLSAAHFLLTKKH